MAHNEEKITNFLFNLFLFQKSLPIHQIKIIISFVFDIKKQTL